MSGDYQLVRLNNGICSVRSLVDDETFHPVIGPVAEAEALYVNQLRLCDRLNNHSGEFVIWDVGLGAAANAIVALRATREISGRLRLLSFDNTAEPLKFALQNSAALGYFDGYENQIAELLRTKRVEFENGKLKVDWEFQLGDFPAWLERRSPTRRGPAGPTHRGGTEAGAPPDAIFYDAFSPAKNPAMWTLPVFQHLFRALDPARPCMLTTYSRSTMIRATLLLAGFFVGAGHATGQKEETTVAANTLELIADPLDARWLERALRSHSAEPLREPNYLRKPLSSLAAAQLCLHPQFNELDRNNPVDGLEENSKYRRRKETKTMSEKLPGAEKKILCGILGILLGSLGIHKFILGYTKEGIIQIVISIFTCGVGGIIGLIEGIIYLTKSDEEFVNTYITNKRGWF